MITGLVDGRAALVSGAGSGIGRAPGRLLGEHGARVATVDINGASAERRVGGCKLGMRATGWLGTRLRRAWGGIGTA